MGFVFYDVETTGLRKRYDQISSFAAVLTDNDLVIQDQFEMSARICPHVLPSPGAIYVTGVGVQRLFDPALPSQYDAVTKIHDVMSAWSPAMFVGFNSVDFDEELLRHAFYQNLKSAFLTSRMGNARADVLGLCRVTAALHPEVLVPAVGPDGRKTFRLAELAAANGLSPVGAHSAMIDVMSTLSLCRHIRANAPDIWSSFSRFSTKGAVRSFVEAEDAFLYFSARPGPDDPLVLTVLGEYGGNPARLHCLDLLVDLDELAVMEDAQLDERLISPTRPTVALRSNAAPIMMELFQASEQQLGGLTEGDLQARAARVHSNGRLGPRIFARAVALQKQYPAAAHVEDRLYGHPFPNHRDEARMAEFHVSNWSARAALATQFEDVRLVQLARRIVFFADPSLLPAADAEKMQRAISNRLSSTQPEPWLTFDGARAELENVVSGISAVGEEVPAHLVEYRRFLDQRQTRTVAPS